MTDRRSFIKAACVAAFAGTAPAAIAAAVPPRHPLDAALAIVDRGLAGGSAYAASVASARVRDFDSDVGPLWMNEIEPRLRAGNVAIAGYTSAATLFCLELMARDYGAGVTRQSAHGAAVQWLLTTNPARRAALAPLAAGRG
jgi:hypothetical protein